MQPKPLLLALAGAALSAVLARADLLDQLTVDIRLGRRVPPPPPAVVVVVPDRAPPGPPPWERSRWGARSHGYYYYPGADIYYRPVDRVWFYLDGGRWRSARRLPERMNVDFNRSVTLAIMGDRPYLYHPQVVARYPSDYFSLRVRLRDDDRRHDPRPDHEGDGRDQGKGNERKRR